MYAVLPRKAQSQIPISKARSTCLQIGRGKTVIMHSVAELSIIKIPIPEQNGQHCCNDGWENSQYSRDG